MIQTLYNKLKAAVRPSDEHDPAPGVDRHQVAQVNEARTDEDRWRAARRNG